jgi:phosphotransferase system enzyme I (PtsI)
MILHGNSAAGGIAVGIIHIYTKKKITVSECFVPQNGEQKEFERYQNVKNLAIDELTQIKHSIENHDPDKAFIFAAHLDIIDDIIINEEIPDKIIKEHWTGDWAIYQVYETCIDMVRKASDPLIAERAIDFDDVRTLLLKHWYGHSMPSLNVLKEPVIIASHNLLPSDTAALDRDKVLAIVCETGGLTSHSAIIAKSYGIPAILGIPNLLDNIKQGQFAIVDGSKLILDPDDSTINEYTQRSEAIKQEKIKTDAFLSKPAFTKDGTSVSICLNIANAGDKELSASDWVDSVGLFRTEFLYMGRAVLPTEEEQFAVYRKVLDTFGDKPVILRTLDIGGDKPLSSISMPREDNPFLGNRALRFCFSRPDIFKTQLRAALRASVYGNLHLMFPMVASLDDVLRAKEYVFSVQDEMQKSGEPFGAFKIGIMIEIPSIALVADIIAREVDFASIGTNDLCQYLCAADRMNSEVEPYYQSYHPAMFRVIAGVVQSFSKEGKPVSICGELGSDLQAVPALLGLGIRKFSMGAGSIAEIKRFISSVTIGHCEELAEYILKCSDSSEIEKLLNGEDYRL